MRVRRAWPRTEPNSSGLYHRDNLDAQSPDPRGRAQGSVNEGPGRGAAADPAGTHL